MKHILPHRLRQSVAALILASLSVVPTLADSFVGGRTDFRDESIYFVITTRFYDGDTGNNVLCWDNQTSQTSTNDPCWRGDFQGLIDKLDYIKALGFSAIWITPVVQNASGYDYHGYHASDFSKVDCRYQSSDGTKSGDVMFQNLIDSAHAKGIKIILDIVLNHTGNFGESTLCPMFTRSSNLNYQGSSTSCLTTNTSILGTDYDDLTASEQYSSRLAMMKNTDGVNHDSNNYWHHFGNFNWDNETRWWAQIAGDCVDLNTENTVVSNYLIKCYEQFMKMGVDGFRIDTGGHIARLTFNKNFIPQFTALGEKYKANRSLYGGTEEGSDFFMFAEVCARYSGAIYRDQDALSPFFYTWSSENGGHSYDWSTDSTEYIGKDFPVSESTSFTDTNRKSCEEEYSDYSSSDVTDFNSTNATLDGNTYHTPDYTYASGLNVIDFPVHYNFTNAASAYNMATGNDYLYNDATYNVVYVDSHDYGPQPSDNIRFSGGTDQWAENMTWMWLFRGIPCIFYGSEVEFQAGQVIDNGTNGPLSNTGRAYFGQNLEGTVTASDFGVFTADGQVAKTLNHPLAKHLERLNRIRQAVPALRKGQYSTDGCTANGGYAWKKRYTSGDIDSYALVCMNGGATFTDILNGTYTDCVTGDVQTVTNNTLTVSSPTNQGNARVYVLNGPGQIGEDGPFLYTSSPSSYDDSDLASDPGTTWCEVSEAAHPSITLSPDGGSFYTETQTVTLTLNNATEGWYKIGSDGEQVSVTDSTSFTIGSDMEYGDSITVYWSATGTNDSETETVTGSATYTKVDPDAAITIYCNASSAPYLYAWSSESGSDVTLNGSWPGTQMTETTTVNGTAYYSKSFSGVSSLNIIFNNGSGSQTDDITGITASTYYTYDGSTTATVVTEIISDTTATDTTATDSTVTDSTTTDSTNIYIPTLESSSEISVFFETSQTTAPYVWVWGTDDVNYNDNGSWPGDEMTLMGTAANGNSIYKWTYTGSLTDLPTGIIFCKDASGTKFNSSDGTFVNHGYYTEDSPLTTSTVITAVESSEATYTPTLDSSDEISVFFETSQTTAPYVWVWGTDNVNYNENGSWPGDEMTLMGTAANGNSIYKWTYTGSLTDLPTGIIFCKDASGTKFNSSDGTFVNHGYYTEDSPLTTSTIITATSTDSAKYSTTTGLSVIETTTTDTDVWYTLQGQRISEPTAHGIYIHDGKKVVK
ncbi:MAG: alpha-amylase family glycosyl hydrolase [Prevotella sp.]|jgi:glycosidase